MMPIPRHRSSAEEAEPWLISYADVITVLLSFFITLLSVANLNKARLDSLSQMFSDQTVQRTMSLPQLQKQLQNLVDASKLGEEVEVHLTDRGVEIQVREKLLFERGKANLGLEAQKVLTRLAGLLNSQAVRERQVIVEGHTDSIPISTAQFASNWELSSARACEVIRFFTLEGIDPARMKAVGYADTKPIEPDIPKVGSAKNRRVVLVIS